MCNQAVAYRQQSLGMDHAYDPHFKISGRGWDTAPVQARRANRQSENRILHGQRPSSILSGLILRGDATHIHTPKTQRDPRLSWEQVDSIASTVRQKGDDIPNGEKHSTSCGDDHFDPAMTWQGLAALLHINNNAGTASFLSWGPQG